MHYIYSEINYNKNMEEINRIEYKIIDNGFISIVAMI
jgi:hypothetical protein